MSSSPIPHQLRRRWPLLVAAGFVVLGLWGLRRFQAYRLYRAARSLEGKEDVVPVKGYRVRARDLAGRLRRIGTVRARAETNLQFGAPGRVAFFDVEKGQFVKRGTRLAALDQAEAQNLLSAAQLEFQKASEKYFQDRTIDRLDYERAKARYTQAKLDADKTVIRAPHDGYLVEKWVNVGEHAEPGTVIGKLMDKSRVTIEMDLSEDDIQHLKKDQKVEVTVDAVPDFKAEGVVDSITPYLKGETRSFNVKVELPENPREVLNPGMFARCSVRRYEKKDALTVPLEASAGLEENEIRLFVVDEQNRLRAVKLPVAFMDEGVVESTGLVVGQTVVLHPGADLDDGAHVTLTDVFDPAAQETSAPGTVVSTAAVAGR